MLAALFTIFYDAADFAAAAFCHAFDASDAGALLMMRRRYDALLFDAAGTLPMRECRAATARCCVLRHAATSMRFHAACLMPCRDVLCQR